MREPSPIAMMPVDATAEKLRRDGPPQAVAVRPLPWPAAALAIALLSLLSWYGLALTIATLLRG